MAKRQTLDAAIRQAPEIRDAPARRRLFTPISRSRFSYENRNIIDYGFPGWQDAYPLNLCLFTSRIQGEALVGIFEPLTLMTDNSKRTGAAIEAHYRLLAWLGAGVEKFPKSHKFTPRRPASEPSRSSARTIFSRAINNDASAFQLIALRGQKEATAHP